MVNEPKKFNYVYQIKNEINGKIYIGKHSTDNFDDNYFGSGFALKRAIKKYGIENFTKTIIDFCPNEEQALELESFIVDKEFILRPDTYNLRMGGTGSILNYNKENRESTKGRITINNGERNTMIKRVDLDEYILQGWKIGSCHKPNKSTREKLSKSSVNTKWMTKDDINKRVKSDCFEKYLQSGWVFGKRAVLSVEGREKISKANKGRVCSLKTRKKISEKQIGKKVSEETIQRLKDSHKGQIVSENQRINLSKIMKEKVWLNKVEKNIRINKKEVDEYISNGWILGRIKGTVNGRVCINDGSNNKFIELYDLEKYLSVGWNKGMIRNNKIIKQGDSNEHTTD